MTNETNQARHQIDGVSVFCVYDEIEKISDLKENPRNPNTHPKEQIKLLAEIIKKTGWRSPITVSTLSGFIVKGHGRLQAAKLAGFKQVPVEYQNFKDEEEELAALLADNKIAELAEVDNEKLTEIFKDYEFEDLSLTGYSQEEFDELVEVFEEAKLLGDPDEVPEEVETRCKLGDIWQLGKHRLMCGDSTCKDDVEKLMNGLRAGMVFTDPPYGYKYESNHQDKFKMLENDDKILDYVMAINGCIKENCGFYSFCGWQSLRRWLEYFETTKLILKNIIIWKKNNWSMGDLKGSYAGQYEVILYFNNGRVELYGNRDTDIWEFDREPPKFHPTMKPIELISYALNKSSKENEIILDCFGGSGSTLIACEQNKRIAYVMELDPHYCDVILTRWETLTGNKAVLLNK